MAIYQLQANVTVVRGGVPAIPALGWYCDTDAEANMVAAAVNVGFIGDNGETYHPKPGDLIRIDGQDFINIIRDNGTIKKL